MLVKKGRGINRLERKCSRCGQRQILLTQFNERVQREIKRHFEYTRKYYTYEKNDWLDHYTTAVLVSKLDDE